MTFLKVFWSCTVLVLIVQFALSEIENWEEYPVILTMEFDKAIYLTPDTGCRVVEDKRLMEKFLFRKNNVFRANSSTARDIIMLCKDFQSERINATQFVIRLHEKSFLIYPGTHYCGVGNNAANFSDLGEYFETDSCCREHDTCKNSVSGWSCHPNITDLCNWAPFTRSHCDCDTQFRECLEHSRESAAFTIGTLFFSVFGLKCFRKDYPIIECAEYGGFLNIHCQKYRLDYTREPRYQFFDSPKFNPVYYRANAAQNLTVDFLNILSTVTNDTALSPGTHRQHPEKTFTSSCNDEHCSPSWKEAGVGSL